jgi:ribose 5-phosphate isomerase
MTTLGGSGTESLDELKQAAARAAVQKVQSGMVVGLGTGSTAAFAVSALAERMQTEGLQIIGVPTSERTAEQARSPGDPAGYPRRAAAPGSGHRWGRRD